MHFLQGRSKINSELLTQNKFDKKYFNKSPIELNLEVMDFFEVWLVLIFLKLLSYENSIYQSSDQQTECASSSLQ